MLLIAASTSSAEGCPGRPTFPEAMVGRDVVDVELGRLRKALAGARLTLDDDVGLYEVRKSETVGC